MQFYISVYGLMKGNTLAKKESYEEFVDKFKPKRTTDDCYTPPEIYDVVAEMVSERYGIAREDMVRPFWPGGDFEAFDYPDGCCVVDNPPFSILSKIERFYIGRGIQFFMFAPTLTLFSSTKTVDKLTHYPCGATVVYENGAKINTSFVSNLGGDTAVDTWPELTAAIAEAEARRAAARGVKRHDAFIYPRNLTSAAKIAPLSRKGVHLEIKHDEIRSVSKVGDGQGIFGGGLLLSDAACNLDAAFCEASRVILARNDAKYRALQLSEADEKIIAELNANVGESMAQKHI